MAGNEEFSTHLANRCFDEQRETAAARDATGVIQTGDVQEAPVKAELARRGLGEGAGQAAPTSPHATPRRGRERRSGPELFWEPLRGRVVFTVCVVTSAVVHGLLVPIQWPHAFELDDVEGEATIPIDLLIADPGGAPQSADHSPNPPKSDEGNGPTAAVDPDRSGRSRRDAGISDAEVTPEAGRDAVADGPPDSSDEASSGPKVRVGRSVDAGGDSEAAPADAGTGGGTRDPEAIIGAASVRADVELVRLVVNVEVIRRNAVGAHMGYLLRGVPQWNDFMTGTDLDPVRDCDWVMISGPSLIHTSRDLIFIHYSATDAAVDRAVRLVSGKYDRGGPFDAGVRGVKASLIHADGAERVLIRPQSRLLAVIPPNVAQNTAHALSAGPIHPHIHPGEALYLRLVNPHRPVPEIPESITELRLRVVPRADDGADVYADGDTKDPEAAGLAADALRRMVRRHNDGITSLLTHGLLDRVDVGTEAGTVSLHIVATRDQLQTLVTLVGDFLGVQPDEPPAASAPVPRASSQAQPPR